MSAPKTCVLDLTSEQAALIDDLVRSGRYSSSSEVLEAGLRALQDQVPATEEWLLQEVLPAMTAMQADPSRGIPAQEVFDEIRTLHAQRINIAGRAI